MKNLLSELRSRLKGKIVILGIGNRLRGDDGAGPEFIKNLKNSKLSTLNSQLFLMDVGEVPENYLSSIVKSKPETIIVVDSGELGAEPGTVKIIEQRDLAHYGLSTHNPSPKLFMEYLKQETKADLFLISIQPKSTKFGKGLSREVRISLEALGEMLNQLLRESPSSNL